MPDVRGQGTRLRQGSGAAMRDQKFANDEARMTDGEGMTKHHQFSSSGSYS
jgi:hypothetical protein